MLPDQLSNPGPLTYESDAYRLRYAARQLKPLDYTVRVNWNAEQLQVCTACHILFPLKFRGQDSIFVYQKVELIVVQKITNVRLIREG